MVKMFANFVLSLLTVTGTDAWETLVSLGSPEIACVATFADTAPAAAPTITVAPAHPTDYADLSVRFPGMPKHVTVVALMSMGSMKMHSPLVTLEPGSDPHVFTGRVEFSMEGNWTLHLVYDGAAFDQSIDVGQ